MTPTRPNVISDRTVLPPGGEDVIRDLADRALAAGTPLAQVATEASQRVRLHGGGTTPRTWLIRRMFLTGDALWRGDGRCIEETWEGVLGWLVVLAGTPDPTMRRLLSPPRLPVPDAENTEQIVWWKEARVFLADWQTGIPSPLAGLAYAAGLTADDARTGAADETLAGDRLLLLAGLRGYVFPEMLLNAHSGQ